VFTGECLNPQILRIVAETGHTDMLCICDAGFPIPQDTERVDLAWKKNNPAWLDICELMKDLISVEKIYLAEEIKYKNPQLLNGFDEIFPNVKISFIPHADIKNLSKSCRAVIRTGEFSAYANCILVAGCSF